MINTKDNYDKACVELYEIIKGIPETEQNKIPKEFIFNLKNNMDKTYKFNFDNNVDVINQNYLKETKALYIKLYKKYLMEDSEKEFWNKYDKICLNMIEEEKNKKYNVENLFKKTDKNIKKCIENEYNYSNNLPIKFKQKFWIKLKNNVNCIKSFFKSMFQ